MMAAATPRLRPLLRALRAQVSKNGFFFFLIDVINALFNLFYFFFYFFFLTEVSGSRVVLRSFSRVGREGSGERWRTGEAYEGLKAGI